MVIPFGVLINWMVQTLELNGVKKRGFYKFGTRKWMIDESHPQFGEAVTLFLEKYNEGLSEVFKSKSYREIRSFVVFAEYFGENSFAGYHIPEDKKDIVLFDVSMYQKGWIKPKDFITDFSHLGIPRVIYHGNFNKKLIQDVKHGVYDVKEGIMVKGLRRTKGDELVWMVKIKTDWWLNKLKHTLGQKYFLKEVNYDKELLI
jgi:hypothetical protein